MMLRPNERLIMLVEAAFGERPMSDLGAVSPSESRRIAQMKSMAKALKAEKFQPPRSLVERAKAVFPAPSSATMRVASSSLQPAAARGAAEVLHVAYQSEEGNARVMYVSEANGWRIVGEAPSPKWSVVCNEDLIETDTDGRFEFLSPTDALPVLVFVKKGVRLTVEPPTIAP